MLALVMVIAAGVKPVIAALPLSTSCSKEIVSPLIEAIVSPSGPPGPPDWSAITVGFVVSTTALPATSPDAATQDEGTGPVNVMVASVVPATPLVYDATVAD